MVLCTSYYESYDKLQSNELEVKRCGSGSFNVELKNLEFHQVPINGNIKAILSELSK